MFIFYLFPKIKIKIKMGYGTRALQQLISYYQGEMTNLSEVEESDAPTNPKEANVGVQEGIKNFSLF